MDAQVSDAAARADRAAARGTLRRGAAVLWEAVRTHPGPFSVALVGATVFALMSVGSTIVLGRVTDELILPAFETGATGRAVLGSVAAIILVALLRAAGVVARRYFCGKTSYRMKVTWRDRLVDRYLSAPLAFHRGRSTGQLMAHADTDTEGATDVINPLPFSISAVMIGVVAAGRLLMVDPVLAVVGIALFPALAMINRVYTVRVEGPAGRVQARFGDLASVAHESFDGALAVKTLGLADSETHRLEGAADALRSQRLRVGQLRAGFEPALDLLPNLGVVALLALGASRLSQGAVSTGELVEAMALFGVLTLPMRVMGYLLEELPRSVVSTDRLREVLDHAATGPAEVTGKAQPPPGPVPVTVDNVTYGFDGAPVLNGVSFTVPAGQVVAVVGSTGSGKSSLFDVITHLAEPWTGTVLLGGVDVSQIDPAVLRDRVALVFQETFLFADTVRENITLGGDFDDDQIAWAAHVARADAFIARLPDGLATVLGERGVTLSGGQRQRIALTRALLRRPSLLLLDDATSAVDPRVEAEILRGLRRALDTTTLVIAHRVSTILLADRVVYLDGGRVLAEGTHQELLAGVPGYAALVRAYENEPVDGSGAVGGDDDGDGPDENDDLASAGVQG